MRDRYPNLPYDEDALTFVHSLNSILCYIYRSMNTIKKIVWIIKNIFSTRRKKYVER